MKILGSFVSQILLLGAFLTAVLWWPARQWQGAEGVASLLTAAGICVAGALAGHAPLWMVRAGLFSSPTADATATLAGTGVRVLATLFGAMIVVLTRPFALLPFVVWLAAYYSAFLVLEVFVSLRAVGQNHAETGPGERATRPRDGPAQGPGAEAAPDTSEPGGPQGANQE